MATFQPFASMFLRGHDRLDENGGVPREGTARLPEAIATLRRAKEHMEHAAHDFGGHRVEAIRATDVAIHQLEDCLKYDRD